MGRQGTKPYNTRATITEWIRRNRRTRKDQTKHNGDYSRIRQSDILGNNTNSGPGADETNHCIVKWRNQEAEGQGTHSLPSRTT